MSLTLSVANAQTQGFAPIATSGYNADVIANGIGFPKDSTNKDVDGLGYVFVSRGWQLDASSTPLAWGVPADGLITSANGTYQLQPYTGNNSLRLIVADPIAANPIGTLTLNEAGHFGTLNLVGATGSGISTVNFTIHFDDGSTRLVADAIVPDWYWGANSIIQGVGRVRWPDNEIEESADNPRMYSNEIVLSCSEQQKKVSYIDIQKIDGTSSITNFFALSGTRVDPVVSGPIAGPGFLALGTAAAFSGGADGGTWSSSNPAVASVDSTGNVTGLSPGSTTISFAAGGQCIPPAATQDLSVGTPIATVTAVNPLSPLLIHQATRISASVTAAPPNAGIPTGTVMVALGTASCSITLNNGSGDCELTPVASGSQTLSASYSGFTQFQPSNTSVDASVALNPSTFQVTSSANPSTPGQAVSFTVAITGVAAAQTVSVSKALVVPTGTVTLSDGATTLGSALLVDGSATISTPLLTALGNHSIVANYSGDANFQAATSTAFAQMVAVPVAPSATPVPSLGQWALMALSALLALLGAGRMRRRSA